MICSLQNQTYLKSLALGLDLLLLLVAGKLGPAVRLVRLVNLVAESVDVTLELVLLVLGLSNKLVLALHVALLLEVLLAHLSAERCSAGGDWEVTLADLLLNLAGLGCLVVGFHGVALLFGDRLLDLLVLDVVALLDVEHTVEVQAGLELADHEVTLVVGLHTLDAEATDPGVHLAGEGFGLGVLGLEVEVLLAVEGQDLS